MGALSGYKIIELSGIGPGPLCGMLLADLGAEVIIHGETLNDSEKHVDNLVKENKRLGIVESYNSPNKEEEKILPPNQQHAVGIIHKNI